MSKVHKLVTVEQRNEEASRWIARLDAGLTADEAQELRQWMWEDPGNEKTLTEMAAFWDKLDVLANLSDLFPHVPHHRTRRWRQFAIAASVLLVTMAGIWNSVQVNRQGELPIAAKATYETRVGDQANVTLTEGSAISMNTNTRVAVTLQENSRLIVLERGEIHVDVAHDADRPFSVVAGNRIVQAVGTAFNVRIDEQQHVEVMVTDGRVLVGVRPQNDAIPAVLAGSSLLISKGERVVLNDEARGIAKLAPQEIAMELSWRDGNVIFRGEPLLEATAEISRYVEIEFVFENVELEKELVAGLFKARDVEGFLASLEANFQITNVRQDEKTILLSRVPLEMQ
jgi:transmembrane sensor